MVSDYAKVVLVDLPGHGKSNVPKGGPIDDLAIYADIVIDAINILNIGAVTLVGHSMSAGIALLIALQQPQLASAVVVVDGGGETNRTHGGALLDLVGANPGEYFEENFRSICSPNTPQQIIEEIAWDVGRCHPKVVYSDICAYSKLSIDNRLSDIDCPVTFIHGVDDWSIPIEIAEASAERIKRSRVIPVENAGHFPHVECPNIFNTQLRLAIGDMS